MSGNMKIAGISAALLLGLAGCASLDAGPGFEEVSGTIGERLGRQIYWRQGGLADRQVDAAVTRVRSMTKAVRNPWYCQPGIPAVISTMPVIASQSWSRRETGANAVAVVACTGSCRRHRR